MKVIEHDLYKEDIEYISNLNLNWKNLKDKSILISGATGLIGSCMIDVLMKCNKLYNLNCKVYALGRNESKVNEKFEEYIFDELFEFIPYDINKSFIRDDLNEIEYIVHLASNTHPTAYSTDPIGTIATNVIGTNNLLEFAVHHNCNRFVFASTCEIYGENRGDTEKFDEEYCGYINCNTLRAGYPESKRCGEALCQAYIKQNKMNIVIPRLARTYGPTMLINDTKAISQFIKKAINGEDIILKSEGNQFYSYTYVVDAVSGLFTVMLNGKCGEAYNIAYEKSDIKLKELANKIASIAGTRVTYELPDEIEKAGYSKATKAILDSTKIKELGWHARFNIDEGIKRTFLILKEIYNKEN